MGGRTLIAGTRAYIPGSITGGPVCSFEEKRQGDLTINVACLAVREMEVACIALLLPPPPPIIPELKSEEKSDG